MRYWMVNTVVVSVCLGCLVAGAWGDEAGAAGRGEYLPLVRAYAYAMLEHGCDCCGAEHSPLFAEEMDRKTMRMLEGKSLQKAKAIPREEWGIRSHDRMLGGANPQHCQNLYQVLYALTEITGEKRYAEAADQSLKHFLEHCQSKATGLFCWGEHAGWDLREEKQLEKQAGDTHEFYRPWVLWEKSWALADKPCRQFALGLWEHQIGDHQTGDFSRHAKISSHGPGTTAPYARHGGFYIETWGIAYEQTKDEVFLEAIRSVLEGLERARLHEGGYLTGGSKKKGGRRAFDISLAVSLGNTAQHIPEELAARLREVAAANDEVFRQIQLDRGFEPAAPAGNLWTNAYGAGPRVGQVNVWMLRYRQTKDDVYRRAILREAEVFRTQEVNQSQPVWPGTVGAAIWLMLNAHELTGKEKYVEAAERFARAGVEMFFELKPEPASSSSASADEKAALRFGDRFLIDGALPKASHVHDHYEAVTNGDTLMMALLRLWLVENRPESEVGLVYCDR